MATYKEVTEKLEQLLALIKEHEQPRIYENCDYHVVPIPGPAYFLLFRTDQQKQVYEGSAQAIRRWLERRGVPLEKVYGYSLIQPKEVPNDTGTIR